ncbi:hypothetical protein FA09DRAFT_218805 [Tilletiopsis washingtonensis]|jgi:hypothetical protein|uniref:Uncharacterized protein n=1 Tax=Tilletiopsis washingtonensis TaxID=58919 RepID=A0A316ZEX3_9BASI|nr:hypothetical protein FA09DRAFT_218805 [Tilletiopsis washingtonensis]PWN99786.1 hypothetical protein FA09DRAFT_218805 [Tilletiopsis washingtonensis]
MLAAPDERKGSSACPGLRPFKLLQGCCTLLHVPRRQRRVRQQYADAASAAPRRAARALPSPRLHVEPRLLPRVHRSSTMHPSGERRAGLQSTSTASSRCCSTAFERDGCCGAGCCSSRSASQPRAKREESCTAPLPVHAPMLRALLRHGGGRELRCRSGYGSLFQHRPRLLVPSERSSPKDLSCCACRLRSMPSGSTAPLSQRFLRHALLSVSGRSFTPRVASIMRYRLINGTSRARR